MASTTTHERYFLHCFSCFCLSLSYDQSVEDAVFMLFGLCHRRCTTTPLSLIPKFNNKDTHSLSSVKPIRYLQFNSIPRAHIPDRPSGEPHAGHQLDRTFIEAFEDCGCGNFESGLSAAISSPDCRRMNERCMIPSVIFSIFFMLDHLFAMLCN
jgi:hypothetical protein